MAKRVLMVLLALSLAAAAFASGQNEKAQPGVFQGDKIVLKGTVTLQGSPHPILKSGDKQYLLMVPRYLVNNSGVKEGAQVTVQGYQLTTLPRFMWSGTATNLVGLFVTQATVDGKDYDLSRYYGEQMMGGRRGYAARADGYGPGYGMMGPGMMGRGYGPGRGMMDYWDGDDR